MISYELHEHPDGCFVIQGREGNGFWLVEAVFEASEKEYAEAFCRILNTETKKGWNNAEYNMSNAYFKATGKFFDYHIK